MSDIYINEATGKKIKVYEETWVHVWDEDDAELNFWDTEQGVAEWCMESIDDLAIAEEDEKCEYCGGDCPHGADEICDEYHNDEQGLYEEHKKYHTIKYAYDNKDWLEVIEVSDCRYCAWKTEKRWVVEEVEDEAKV